MKDGIIKMANILNPENTKKFPERRVHVMTWNMKITIGEVTEKFLMFSKIKDSKLAICIRLFGQNLKATINKEDTSEETIYAFKVFRLDKDPAIIRIKHGCGGHNHNCLGEILTLLIS